MTITHILIFAGASIPFMALVPAVWRPIGLLIGSVLALVWLQDAGNSQGLDLFLPAATLILTVAVWWVVQPVSASRTDAKTIAENWMALLAMGGALTLIVLGNLLVVGEGIPLELFLSGVVTFAVTGLGLSHFLPVRRAENNIIYKQAALFLIIGVVLILALLKIPALARFTAQVLDRETTANLKSINPFVWLGFSYIAFRLMALLLDFRADRLPKEGFSLRDMAVYILFFPALTAGPIDRAQRFIPELRQTVGLDAPRLVEGSTRIAIGIFKKFVVADSLALVAMNPTLIDRTTSTAGLWLILYLYALQIFFDFSGYSDVALGLGRLYGVTLPENFDRPYLQPNIQQFWNRWHITLSTWFRLYFFTPFSRLLMKSRWKLPQNGIVFAAQLSTMILIGLWHGATANFILWGIWHGVGLFLFKLVADNTRGWYRQISQRRTLKRLLYVASVLLTFHYVALGWVFFALPEPADSFDMLTRLVGR